ncbi:MAG: metallophosphoesterase [Phaeodactylibacter sp.]|nr:metallophosphoesterase [Phaeodactylibacter sp.]
MKIASVLARLGLIVLWFPLLLKAQSPAFDSQPSFKDGPYVFYEGATAIARWITEEGLTVDTLEAGQPMTACPGFSVAFDPSWVQPGAGFTPDSRTAFRKVERIAAVSDIHGQYGLLVTLLKAHGIIDADSNWSFGRGHLVVLGDIFDRGDEVTELLWFVYKLEQQAEKTGGKVHYLLGNHEVMALKGDLRYVHKKYRYTMARMGMSYDQLFGKDTFLGRWLRSRPVAISINRTAFVHAGLSRQLLEMGLTFGAINDLFREQILDQPEDSILADPYLAYLYSENGPVWYRGYFEDDFTRGQAQWILNTINKRHLVVGHTSFSEIVSLFNNRIIGIDSSIKLGNQGEILLIEKNKFYRGTLNGEKIRLN